MGLLDFIFKKNKKQYSVTDSNYNSPFTYYNLSDQTLASNETIFAAVSLLSNAIASAPVSLNKNYKKLNPANHNVASMCQFGFNTYMTTFEFIRAMETERCINGAAYAIKEYDRIGQVIALWPLCSEYIKPFYNEQQELYYHIQKEGVSEDVYSGNILHVDFISSDGLKGISPISVLADSLLYSKKIEQLSLKQLENGIRPSIAIKINGEWNNEMMEKYTVMLNKFKNSGILFLDPTKQIQELKQNSIIDPKLFEAEQITIKKVASVFNIPVCKLWGDVNSTNSEESDIAYMKDTILPIVRLYEQALNKSLLTESERLEGYEIKLNMNGFARAGMTARGDFYFKMIRSGIMSPNDIRKLEDLPPYDGGDVYYVSRDLISTKLLEDYTLKDIGKDDDND